MFTLRGRTVTLPYVTVTFRVPSQTAAHCRDLAQNLGWQLADFLRTMICIGAVIVFLAAGNSDSEKAANTLLGLKLVELSNSFNLRFSQRPYAFRIPGRESTLLSLSLPKSICALVSTYAGLKNASRNQAYNKLLQQGVQGYLKAQTSLLEALGMAPAAGKGGKPAPSQHK